jgi:hypothetical protein
MCTQVGAGVDTGALVGLVLVGVVAAATALAAGGLAPSGPTGSAAGPSDAPAPGHQSPTAVHWNDTYTPGTESGVLLEGVPVADGGFLLVGSFGPPDETDRSAFAVRVDAAGAVEWVWSLQGYGTATLAGAVQRDDGGFVVAGTRRTPEEGPRRLVAGLTPGGDIAWQDTYGSGRVTDVVPASDGALLVGGDEAGRITANGGEVWVEQYHEADIDAAARIGDGYVLAGSSTAGDDPDRLLVRIDGTGEALWRTRRDGAGPDRYVDVVVEGDTIYGGGAAPLGEGSDVHPSVSAVHPNGTRDRSRTKRRERPGEAVTGVSAAERGALAAIRGDERSRLAVFAPRVAGATVDVDARLASVTALGDGRYLLTGSRDGEAFAAVVRPDFDRRGSLFATQTDDPDRADPPSDTTEASGESGDGGSPEDEGLDLPPPSPGDVPPVVTLVLIVAAAVTSLSAIAVTALSLRQL